MDASVEEALEKLRVSGEAMTEWERLFIVSVSQRGHLSAKQRQIVADMVEQYLGDRLLAGDVLGQERLFR